MEKEAEEGRPKRRWLDRIKEDMDWNHST